MAQQPVVIFDARDAAQQPKPQLKPRSSFSNSSTSEGSAASSKHVSVARLLENVHEVPSAKRRLPVYPVRLSGNPGKVAGQYIPQRTSKTSEKLVLLPDKTKRVRYDDDEPSDDDAASMGAPAFAPMPIPPPSRAVPKRSMAEKLPKEKRTEKLARVTAYCMGEEYRLKAVSDFLADGHAVQTRTYDEALYAAYFLPLLPGINGSRVRTNQSPRMNGERSLLDEQIERSERHLDYQRLNGGDEEYGNESIAEMFVFSYGVVVFWNFSEHQEKDILADLTFATTTIGGPLLIRPLREQDVETEDFHFDYSPETRSARIYNDLITLRSGDHMIKLAMSHALAQSTKLARFEERMAVTMLGVQNIPKNPSALTGKVGMRREDVSKMSEVVLKLRVDVNLSSNVLDTPEFFWEEEPSLNPLYTAVREYLEIEQRVSVLNERSRVFQDLTDVLSDSIAESNLSRVVIIIIVLLVLCILLTTVCLFALSC